MRGPSFPLDRTGKAWLAEEVGRTRCQLTTFCMTGVCVPQVAIYRCLLDIAAGMDYLHSLGVLHGEPILTHPGTFAHENVTAQKTQPEPGL